MRKLVNLALFGPFVRCNLSIVKTNLNKRIIIYITVCALIIAGLFFYLHDKNRGLGINIENPTAEAVPVEEVVAPKMYTYIEVVSSCGANYEGICAKAYAKPDSKSRVRGILRNGVVLKVAEKVFDVNGAAWYKIKFEKVRYPERVAGDWYISQDFAREFEDIGEEVIPEGVKIETNQRIVVDISEQKLQAFDGDVLAMEMVVSTGTTKTPTPIGDFTVFMKMPSRYMQAPQPGNPDYYDLPGVPWDMYFDRRGNVIHGAYWHNSFGHRRSHGCVNLSPDDARMLYMWAKLGVKVTIQK